MWSTTKNKFWKIEQPHKVLFVKKTAPAAQRWFCRVNRRQNESGVLRGGKFFRGLFLTEVVGLTVITNHFLWLCSKWTRPHLVDGFKSIYKINLQKQWDLQEKYHCMWNASRRFCKNCYAKSKKVRRIQSFCCLYRLQSAKFCKWAWPKWSSVSSCS